MELTESEWYSIALGSFVGLTLAANFILTILKLDWVGSRQCHRFLMATSAQRRPFFFILPLFAGNILALSLYTSNVDTFIRRSGLLCLINLVPLMLGGRMNFILNQCRISLSDFAITHRWLGWLCIAEGIVHVTAGFNFNHFGLRNAREIAGLVGSAVLVVMLLSSPVRRYIHETFSWIHTLFAMIVIVSAYVHIPSRKILQSPAVYVLAAFCTLVLIWGTNLVHFLFRNVRSGQPLSEASVHQINFKRPGETDIIIMDAVQLHVRLSAPWVPRPGHYVYLCIPGASITSFAQMHPFYVAWCYTDEKGKHYAVFLVQTKKGFTKSIASHASRGPDDRARMKTVMAGPFGHEMDLGLFGTVLLFATGIGIAAQLPYVSQLLADYQDNETRRIALFWQVDSEAQTAWVADQMQELLRLDVKKILDIRLFVVGALLSETTRRGDYVKLGERIDLTYDVMDAGDLIRAEMNGRKGRIVVALCVDKKTNNEIRKAARRSSRNCVHLKELPFHPVEEPGLKEIVKAAAEFGRVVLNQVRSHSL